MTERAGRGEEDPWPLDRLRQALAADRTPEPPTTDPGRERIRSLAEEIVSKQGVAPDDRYDWIAEWSARLRVLEQEVRAEEGDAQERWIEERGLWVAADSERDEMVAALRKAREFLAVPFPPPAWRELAAYLDGVLSKADAEKRR